MGQRAVLRTYGVFSARFRFPSKTLNFAKIPVKCIMELFSFSYFFLHAVYVFWRVIAAVGIFIILVAQRLRYENPVFK